MPDDDRRTWLGRILSQEPNLQNIPIRTEEGQRIRNFFLSPNTREVIDAFQKKREP